MKRIVFILLLIRGMANFGVFAQQLPPPDFQINTYFFTDSCEITIHNPHEEGTIQVEINQGKNVFFRDYEHSFYVDKTRIITSKLTHPDFADSRISTAKVYKLTDLELDILGEHQNLTNKTKGTSDLSSEEWSLFNESKVEFQIKCSSKKLEEIELLSHVSTKEDVFPPKKVTVCAHLKNGERVHLRSSNTIGSFKNAEHPWSHVVRLAGKPKLKKILRKTEYFTLTAEAKVKDGIPQKMAFDEILVR